MKVRRSTEHFTAMLSVVCLVSLILSSLTECLNLVVLFFCMGVISFFIYLTEALVNDSLSGKRL